MRLARNARRSADIDRSMIPMINMVFLLLIFFMVAGTIRPSAPLPVSPPESSGDAESSAQRVLHVGTDGSLVLNETPVISSELPAALMKTPASVAAEGSVSDSPEGSPAELPLAIRADAGISIVRLRDVIDHVRAAGLSQVELLTERIPAHRSFQRGSRRSTAEQALQSP